MVTKELLKFTGAAEWPHLTPDLNLLDNYGKNMIETKVNTTQHSNLEELEIAFR